MTTTTNNNTVITNNTVTTVNTVAFRAYVANLGKYNEGEILGEWVSFPLDDEAREDLLIRLKLAHRDDSGELVSGYQDSTGAIYEEYIILDYDSDEEFPTDKFGEYASFDELNDHAERFAAFDDCEKLAFRAAVEEFYNLKEAFEKVENGDYRVYYNCDTMTDVAETYADETCMLNEIPEHLRYYFDFAALGRDMEIEGTYVYIDGNYVEFY